MHEHQNYRFHMKQGVLLFPRAQLEYVTYYASNFIPTISLNLCLTCFQCMQAPSVTLHPSPQTLTASKHLQTPTPQHMPVSLQIQSSTACMSRCHATTKRPQMTRSACLALTLLDPTLSGSPLPVLHLVFQVRILVPRSLCFSLIPSTFLSTSRTLAHTANT